MSERSNPGQAPKKEPETKPVGTNVDPNLESQEPGAENPKSTWAKGGEDIIAKTVVEMAADLHDK